MPHDKDNLTHVVVQEMQPFRTEIMSILGWHDGHGVHLEQIACADALIVTHERAHAELFRSSPDGLLISMFVSAYRSGRASDFLRAAIEDYFEVARYPHECAATYLGIQMLMTDRERVEAQSRITTEYEIYYRSFADLFDRISPSTFLRVAFAKAAANLIFSSRAICMFVESNFDSAVFGDQRFDPRTRQEEFRTWWLQDGYTSCVTVVQQVLAQAPDLDRWAFGNSAPSTDFGHLDDDLTWIENPALAGIADNYIISYLYEHMVAACPLDSISSGSDEYAEVVQRTAPFIEAHGYRFSFTRGGTAAMPQAGEMLAHLLVDEFVVAARTCVHLDPLRHIGSITQAPEEIPFGYLLRSDQAIFDVVFSEAGIADKAIIETWDRGDIDLPVNERRGPYCYSVGLPRMFSIIHNLMYDRHFGFERSHLGFVVAPALAANADAGSRNLYQWIHTHPGVPVIDDDSPMGTSFIPRQLVEDEICFWYVTDGWSELIGVSTQQNIQIGWAGVHVSGYPDFLLSIARIGEQHGTFMKAVPIEVGPGLIEYYRKHIDTGHYRTLDGEADRALHIAAVAFKACLRHWARV